MRRIILLLVFFIFNSVNGQYFTDTKGELQVSNSGQATYTLPIATPPSIKNVAPVINLTYTSGTMGGIAGQGWHINSISNISRIATRKDIDGFIDGVDFDDNDKLALDGQRLILKSGTYWENGSTYETEFKSNAKIELAIQSQGTYFVVTNPDGSRSWYGSTGTGTVIASVNAWYLVRFEDVYGNFIRYNYENLPYTGTYQSSYGVFNAVATTQYYIKDIEFSGNAVAGISAANKIEFNYRSAPIERLERAFVNGQPSYAFKILDNIKVYTGGNLFKRYQLTHVKDALLGYETLTKIQEFNGSDEPANPVAFSYYTTENTSNLSATIYYNNLLTRDIKVSGDFDGDGKVDFITSNYMYKNLFVGGTGPAPSILPAIADNRRWFAAVTLSDNKLNQFQSLVFASERSDATDFKVYNSQNNSISLSYTKTVTIDNTIFHNVASDQHVTYGSNNPGPGYDYCHTTAIKPSTKYYEGDYNGDGISEVLIASKKDQQYFNFYRYIYSHDHHDADAAYCESIYSDSGTDFYLLNLDPNTSTALGSSGYVKLENADALKGGKLYVMDFNGDGKADVLSVFADYTYKVVGFKQLNTAPWVEVEILGYGSMPNYAADKLVLFGDYNGDGKTDVMVPEAVNSPNWYIYYANPKPNGGSPFFNREMHSNLLLYQPQEHPEYTSQQIFNEYYAADINKDGKTDIVRFRKRTYQEGLLDHNSSNSEYFYETYVNNIGNIARLNTFTKNFASPMYSSSIGTLPVTIGANPKFSGIDQDFVLLWNNNIVHYITFTKDVRKDCQLASVVQSGGAIGQTVEYEKMEASDNNFGNITDFYSSANASEYPFVEMKRSDTYLVSRLTAIINGRSKFQNFKYRGFVINVNGIGAIGFNKNARSSWYVSPSDTKIWTIENKDATLRGATTRTWTNTNAATIFDTEPDNLLNKKTNVFATSTSPSGVYSILLNSQTILDARTNVSILSNYTYDPDGYGIQIQSVTQNLLGNTIQGETTVISQYDNNPAGTASSYCIGRPKQVNTTTSVYAGTPNADTGLLKKNTSLQVLT